MEKSLLYVQYAVLPKQGEDSFAVRSDGRGAMLCVADGCGGLGGKRYGQLGDHTGAYLASRLVTRAFTGWAEERKPMPDSPEDGRALCAELEGDLRGILEGFARRNCQAGAPGRIVGSMQRVLPTTLCAAMVEGGSVMRRECLFIWAGDSRGYVLDAGGLHQCTRDDTRGVPDPFESLYRDAPLSNLLSADQPPRLSMRRVTAQTPCAVICATDGAFGCLPTPMEFEMLLLSTMLAANTPESWERRMQTALRKLAHDDATILCLLCGFQSFDEVKAHFAPRRETLKNTLITPVRRRRHDMAFKREKWREYEKSYDWTGGAQHGQNDWRI